MKKQTKFILSWLLLAAVAAAALTGCDDNTPDCVSHDDCAQADFTVAVTDGEEQTTHHTFTSRTCTSVADALLEDEFIEGDYGTYGLMVSHVNGIRADFDEDGAWWAFLIDGEMAFEGVSSIYITEGAAYAFVFTPA